MPKTKNSVSRSGSKASKSKSGQSRRSSRSRKTESPVQEMKDIASMASQRGREMMDTLRSGITGALNTSPARGRSQSGTQSRAKPRKRVTARAGRSTAKRAPVKGRSRTVSARRGGQRKEAAARRSA